MDVMKGAYSENLRVEDGRQNDGNSVVEADQSGDSMLTSLFVADSTEAIAQDFRRELVEAKDLAAGWVLEFDFVAEIGGVLALGFEAK